MVVIGEIFNLRLQIDDAVVIRVRHFLYIAVLAKLVYVREMSTILFPVMLCKLFWSFECSFIFALFHLTFILVLLMVLKYVFYIVVI